MFNANDIPIRGFVRHVALHDGLMSAQLAALATRLVSGAPGFDRDKAQLDHMLSGGEERAAAVPASIDATFSAEVIKAVSELSDDERALIESELPAGHPDHSPTEEATGTEGTEETAGIEGAAGPEAFSLATPLRFVRWAKLFCQSRPDLVALYSRFFSGAVDLAIPMLVDLASGLEDTAQTTLDQQIELFEMLSRASMLGLIPGAEQLRIHPFVGFDPLRVLNAGYESAVGRAVLRSVQDAVLEKGFAGVKVYPEMGWRAYGNTAANAGTAERARELDAILDDFFGWCVQNEVPVAAHCNHSNYPNANNDAASYGSPDEWLHVLRAHPALRLNLGHFGGAHNDPGAYTWAWTIANAMASYDGLYADVGCHHADDADLMKVHFDVLRQMAGTTKVTDRLMFGTDWYMEAVNPNPNAFLDEYQKRYQDAFGEDQTAKFMSGNALRFLGFAEGAVTQNGRRLRERYTRLGLTMPSWLGTEAAG